MPFPILVLLAPTAVESVSVRTLLPEMVDMTHLTRPPRPRYTAAQASSYDRASDPGATQDWFANADAGKFLRTEDRGDRREYVMADLKGAGAVVRIWSANPTGILRFYFDGEATPRLAVGCEALLTGRDPRFPDPFAYKSAMGTNLYYPLPYAKSLKVTVDDSGGKDRPLGFYYHVGYRTYEPGTSVETFVPPVGGPAPEATQIATHLRSAMAAAIARPSPPIPLLAGKARTISVSGPGLTKFLQVRIPFPLIQSIRALDWTDPHQPHQVLRNLRLTISADSETTVDVPLGDFFGSAPGLTPYRTLPFEVRADGTMICRLPMPFRRNLRVSVTNTGKVPVPIEVNLTTAKGSLPADAYLLHAQWTAEDGLSRPFKDMTFLNARGEGYWLGSVLHVGNSNPAWWGEGDEKIYVDGENFPSTFGTGTEDYYGYAWCSPEPFQRPYHAQPRCDGPGNFGHTNVNRFHILDPIPYRRSLKFDLERWHWANVPTTFARTAYWYAKAGGTRPASINTRLLPPPNLEPPKPVEGALEGESLNVTEMTGGSREAQGGFWELSAGKQLWWKGVEVGHRLKLKVPVAEAGRYEVVGNFCHAVDYGIHQIRLAGEDLGRHDFFGPEVRWKRVSLGTVTLQKGEVEMEIECVGARPEAKPGRMFGLDYLLLKRK